MTARASLLVAALSAEEIRDLIGYLMQPAQVPLP